MAQNPVINKFGQGAGGFRGPATPSAAELHTMYGQPAYTGPRTARYMTLDDVVVRTGAMLGVLLVAGALSWGLVTTRGALPVILIAGIGSLFLGYYMAWTARVNAPLALIYAAGEGALLGAISRIFNTAYQGIVVEAVTGTVMVAAGMLFVYRIGAIRVTPRFTRVFTAGMIGVIGLFLVNLVAYLFSPNGIGLGTNSGLAVVFSLVCIVLASMSLIRDFDMIERGIRNGADQRFAWYAAFGLTLSLVWLYLNILRLLSFMRQ